MASSTHTPASTRLPHTHHCLPAHYTLPASLAGRDRTHTALTHITPLPASHLHYHPLPTAAPPPLPTFTPTPGFTHHHLLLSLLFSLSYLFSVFYIFSPGSFSAGQGFTGQLDKSLPVHISTATPVLTPCRTSYTHTHDIAAFCLLSRLACPAHLLFLLFHSSTLKHMLPLPAAFFSLPPLSTLPPPLSLPCLARCWLLHAPRTQHTHHTHTLPALYANTPPAHTRARTLL